MIGQSRGQWVSSVWAWLKAVRQSIRLLGPGLWLLNFVVQRIFGINGDSPWTVHYTSRVISPEQIRIGKDVWVSFAVSGNCYLQAGNGIIIGDETIFAPGVKIISANHDPRAQMRWIPSAPIEIGSECWIGANAVILPGVKLADGCVVGAGAVVTKSFPAHSTIVGVPAQLAPRKRQDVQQD